ncbi:hypothetical protein EXN66_Car014209 [Channa argus]|uniref:Uncharacterized protein n=1 Tax=Channa argus TaxID=215402 RepID=A0A6G1Q868_CHAAH|nr:hypothetical protein EXN66_Car014209 [Channa argus]
MRLFHCDYLIFGDPIRLNVVPSDSSFVAPSLFVLSPLQPAGSSAATQGLDVCFAASFRPKDGEMVVNVKNRSEPIRLKTNNAALHVKSKTYFYAGFIKETIESCELHNTEAQREIKKEVHCETKETSNEIPAQETQTIVDIFPEQAKENHFLLLMNGIRVVFTKTLAFNMLLTIRNLLF